MKHNTCFVTNLPDYSPLCVGLYIKLVHHNQFDDLYFFDYFVFKINITGPIYRLFTKWSGWNEGWGLVCTKMFFYYFGPSWVKSGHHYYGCPIVKIFGHHEQLTDSGQSDKSLA